MLCQHSLLAPLPALWLPVSTVRLSHLGTAAFGDRRTLVQGQVKRPQGSLHSCECLQALWPWALCLLFALGPHPPWP